MEGWVKLYRKSMNHWLYNEARPHTKREAWEDILLLSNHEDTKVLIDNEIIECKRGQSLMSLKSWAKHFKWTIQKVRTFFILLENDSMIIKEGLRKTTRVTVCNYDIYQDKQHTDNTQITHKQHADNTQVTTNKNDKNDKNDKEEEKKEIKKEISELINSKKISKNLKSVLKEFVSYRSKIKKPLKTTRTIESLINKIGSEFIDEEHLIQCIDFTMDKEYQGVRGEYIKDYNPEPKTIKKEFVVWQRDGMLDKTSPIEEWEKIKKENGIQITGYKFITKEVEV